MRFEWETHGDDRDIFIFNDEDSEWHYVDVILQHDSEKILCECLCGDHISQFLYNSEMKESIPINDSICPGVEDEFIKNITKIEK